MDKRTIRTVSLHYKNEAENSDKVYHIQLYEQTTSDGRVTYGVDAKYGRRGSNLKDTTTVAGVPRPRADGAFMDKFHEKTKEGYKVVGGDAYSDVEDTNASVSESWESAADSVGAEVLLDEAPVGEPEEPAEPETKETSWPGIPFRSKADTKGMVYQRISAVTGFKTAFFKFRMSFGEMVFCEPQMASIASSQTMMAHMLSQMRWLPDGVYDGFFGDDESLELLDVQELAGQNFEEADFATRWEALVEACARNEVSFLLADTVFDVDYDELIKSAKDESGYMYTTEVRVLCRPDGPRSKLSDVCFLEIGDLVAGTA